MAALTPTEFTETVTATYRYTDLVTSFAINASTSLPSPPSTSLDVVASVSFSDGFSDVTTDHYEFVNNTHVWGNATQIPPPSDALITAYNVMVAVNSAFITMSMGAGVYPTDVLPHIKRPYGPLIGVCCQSLLMPALCFGYAVLFDLATPVAMGMIITGSCPGGALSNIFTYWSRGELTLSVTMTVFSTTLSIGFMPLNMFLYSRYWFEDDEVADIPYVNMVISMLYTWVAAAIGMLIAWKLPKVAKYVVKVGSGLGFLFMVIVGILQNELYGGTGLFDVGAAAWAGSMLMPLVGSVLGFVISSMFCLKLRDKKAIAYETGTQNVAVALTVIALSAPDSQTVGAVSPVPMIYAFAQIVVGVGSSGIHQLYYRSKEKTCPFNKCASDDDVENSSGTPNDGEAGNVNPGYEMAESECRAVDMDPDPGESQCPGTSTSPPVVSVLHPAANVHVIELQLSCDSET